MAEPGANGPGADIVRDHIFITEGGELRTIAVSSTLPPSMARSGLWRVEDFDLHKELYRGKTSLLYMATDKRSGIQVALKLYRKRKLSTLNRYQVEREIRIHIQLDHVNIIKLFAAFEDEKNVYMVQEFAGGGDLFEDLKKNGGQIKEKYAVRDVIVPFLNALQYLHGMGIIHRDIKPENILLTTSKVIKIADFGLSINVNQERPVTRAGTLDYMAPEVLICPDKRRPEENKDKVLLAYTAQVDAWAVGILAYELLVGYPPFEQESRAATYEHIMYKEPKFPSWMTEDAKKFILCALCKNASTRPTIGQLSKEAWILAYAKPVERLGGRAELEVERSTSSMLAMSLGSPVSPAPRPAVLLTGNRDASMADASGTGTGAVHGVSRMASMTSAVHPPPSSSSPPPASKLTSPTGASAGASIKAQDQYQLSLSEPNGRMPPAIATPNSLGKRDLKPSVSGGTGSKLSSSSVVVDEDASYSPIGDYPHPGLEDGPGSPSNSPVSRAGTSGGKRPSSHLKSRLGSNAQSQLMPGGKVLALHAAARSHTLSNSGADPGSPGVERSGGSYYKPQSGILSDDAALPRTSSMSGAQLSPLQQQMLFTQAGRSNSGSLAHSPLSGIKASAVPEEAEEGGGADSKANSKYAKLFAKMWGGKPAAAADADAFKVQGSIGSGTGGVLGSSGSSRSPATMGGKPKQLRSLQEEMLASREASMVVAGREESVVGAPTMRFKQPDVKALQAIRAANAASDAKPGGHGDPRVQLMKEELGPMARINSEAVMNRPGFDKSMGRSFTTANSPTMKKLANAPIVNKIEAYVQQNAGHGGAGGGADA